MSTGGQGSTIMPREDIEHLWFPHMVYKRCVNNCAVVLQRYIVNVFRISMWLGCGARRPHSPGQGTAAPWNPAKECQQVGKDLRSCPEFISDVYGFPYGLQKVCE